MLAYVLVTGKQLFLPWLARCPVKDHQMPFASRTAIHIRPSLFYPRGDRLLQALVEELEFDDDLLYTALIRPEHQQIRTHPAQAVLALNPPTAVDNTL